MRVLQKAISFIVLGFFVGCAGAPVKEKPPQAEYGDFSDIKEIVNEVLKEKPPKKLPPESLPQVSERSAKEVSEDYTEKEKKNLQLIAKSKFNVEVNPLVTKWIKFFTERARDRFQRYLKRGEKYQPQVKRILRKYGVPEELYYLAMIESGYSMKATSHKGAAGIWQFIRPTGKRYGLHIERNIDERRDPIRSTESAARYLRDLYNVFHSWYLAMAAYNAGEQRVLGAILRGKSRNFWTLVKDKRLPRETRNYVPKFVAALIIGQDPTRFGFEKSGSVTPVGEAKKVRLPSPIHLKTVAKHSGVSYAALKEVNPHLRRSVTPRAKHTYEVWIPENRAEDLDNYGFRKKLSKYRLKSVRSPKRAVASRSGKQIHVVRRGENLTSIARKYRMSVAQLKKLNRLKSDRIFVGKKLVLNSKRIRKHRVKRGENLFLLARRFGMSVGQLKKMNGLRKNTIYEGQTLKFQDSI